MLSLLLFFGYYYHCENQPHSILICVRSTPKVDIARTQIQRQLRANEIERDVRVAHVRRTSPCSPFCSCVVSIVQLSQGCRTSSLIPLRGTHVANRRSFAASFLRHPHGQNGTIALLFLPSCELTVFFPPPRPPRLSPTAKKRRD